MVTVKSNNVINKRDKLSKDITHYWRIIRNENKLDANETRNYNLDEINSLITDMGEKRIKVKLISQAINSGIKIFDYTKFKNETNWEAIFTLSELNEQYTQWDIIQKRATIDPKIKYAKGKGKNKTNEHFTFAKIRTIKKKLQLQIDALHKKIEDFNTNFEIELPDDYNWLLAA